MRLIDADATYAHIVKSAAYRVTKAYRNKSVAEARGMKEAANMVSEAPTVDRWIKIDPKDDKTLPKRAGWYWTYSESEECSNDLYWNGEAWNSETYAFGTDCVTHWMPLPEPPK